mmetsp:Transcript_66597/g.198191  ORF Transcript_66597/g.198191 Transcript_66597/m.198191 type:complete len:470 (-) Transcript_66597:56-1465(-)
MAVALPKYAKRSRRARSRGRRHRPQAAPCACVIGEVQGQGCARRSHLPGRRAGLPRHVGRGLGVGLLAVDVLVYAGRLLMVEHPHAHDDPQQAEEQARHHRRVGDSHDGARRLLAQQRPPAAVEEAAVDREGAREDGAREAPDAVKAKCVQGVVDALDPVDQTDGGEAGGGPQEAHRDGAQRRHEAGRRGDHHKAAHGADHCTDAGRLPHEEGLQRRPAEHGGGGREVGGGEGTGGHGVRREGRASVEPAPAEPQQGRAQEHERHVVGPVLLALVGARTEDHGRDQAGRPRAHVHHGSPREVQGAPRLHPASGTPDPVAEGHVDEHVPQCDEEDVRPEADALDEGAGHDGCGYDRECHLVDGKRQGPDASLAPSLLIQPVEDSKLKVSDDGASVAEREAEAEQSPDDADDGHRDDAHHHGVDDAGVPHEASVEEGEAGRHEQDECRGDENPGRVTLVGAHDALVQSSAG